MGAAAVVSIYAGACAKLEQTVVGTPGHGPHVYVFAMLSVHVGLALSFIYFDVAIAL